MGSRAFNVLVMVVTAASSAAGCAPNTKSTGPAPSAGTRASDRADDRDRGPVTARMARLPLRFDVNRGQWDPKVAFAARGAGYGLFLSPVGATLALHRSRQTTGPAETASPDVETAVVSMHVLGGRASQPVGEAEMPGRGNYIVGSDPAKWRMNVESYARVAYHDVRPGVDVVFYGNGQRALEYDVVVAAGVDPKTVTLAFDGADRATVDQSGGLVLAVGTSELRQPPLVAYQTERDGTRTPVAASYDLRPGGVGFVLGRHDRGRAVVIDPVLSYATYLGGTLTEDVGRIAVDAAGNAYIGGYTQSLDFPTAAAYRGSFVGGTYDAFVTKLSDYGAALVYSTYLGGHGDESVAGIAVDTSGDAYVTGSTNSDDFPTAGAFQGSRVGGSEVYVTKLSPGGALVYSTYLGGGGDDFSGSVGLDAARNAYVVGYTTSDNFPTMGAYQPTRAGNLDVFVTKLATSGASLVYSTYVGGSGDDYGFDIAVDVSGAAYVTGFTQSTNFPKMGAFQGSFRGGAADSFVTKLSASGASLGYSTYLGGGNDDYGRGIAVDASGSAYVTGYTTSTDFPTLNAFQGTNAGGQDAFVTRLSPAGAALVYSTYLGGSGNDYSGWEIALDVSGNAYVSGATFSTNFPVAHASQGSIASVPDAFVTELSASGGAVYSTYLGGTDGDYARGIAVDAFGSTYVAGFTVSADFPATGGAFQRFSPSNGDLFVAKLSPAPPAPTDLRFAVVHADGTLVRGSGVVATSHPSAGTYEVQFAVDVSGCSYVATIGDPSNQLQAAPGLVFAGDGHTSTSSVYVQTKTPQGVLSDYPFHLSVRCDANAPWAVVSGTGATRRSAFGGVATHLGNGVYEVRFNGDVTNCAYTASVDAAQVGDPGTVFTAGGHSGPSYVYVETKNPGGGTSDYPFHLQVTCGTVQPWAVVNSNAAAIRGGRMVGTSHLGPGKYEVLFDRDVSACAYTATIGDVANGIATAPGWVFTAGGHGGPSRVYLETKNPGGGLADYPFHVVVTCPPQPSVPAGGATTTLLLAVLLISVAAFASRRRT